MAVRVLPVWKFCSTSACAVAVIALVVSITTVDGVHTSSAGASTSVGARSGMPEGADDEVVVSSTGSVSVNGDVWLEAAAPRLHCNGWVTLDVASATKLPPESGVDAVGAYSSRGYSFVAGEHQ